MRASVALILLFLPVVSDASPHSVRVQRLGAPRLDVLAVEDVGATYARLVTAGAPPPPGEGLLLVDGAGPLGRAQVIADITEGCGGHTDVEVRLDGTLARPAEGLVVAIGPLARAPADSRTLFPLHVPMEDLPSGVRWKWLEFALDFDRDGKADYARYVITGCRERPHLMDCMLDWQLGAAGWDRVATAETRTECD